LIEAEGLKILHLGDLGHKLSEKQLEEVGEVNVLMVPVGDVFSLDQKKQRRRLERWSLKLLYQCITDLME